MTRISAVGAYAPRLRITDEAFEAAWGSFDAPGIETKAVPDADEDALTMGVEAGHRALDAGGVDSEAIDWLGFATTTPPVDEEDLVPRATSLLGVDAAKTATFGGSTRAGTQALVGGLETDVDGYGLAIAADCPQGTPDSAEEHAAGAAAAAVLLGPDGAAVRATAEATTVTPGIRFRRRGSRATESLGVTAYERSAFRTAVTDAVEALGEDVSTVDAAAIQAPDGRLPYRAARRLDLETEQVTAAETVSTLGDCGAASPLLGMARALDEGLERTLVVGFGGGSGATALVIEGTAPTDLSLEPQTSLEYAAYLRRRGDITSGAPEGGGAYVSVPTWVRSIPQRHRLVAGRCEHCDRLAFPPEGACRSCGRLAEYAPVALEGTGTVEAVTEISSGGAPPEFVEQQARSGSYASAIVGFDGPEGGTVSAPAQVVLVGETTIGVGDRVETVLRRIYTQEGVTRYGFKVVPVAGPS